MVWGALSAVGSFLGGASKLAGGSKSSPDFFSTLSKENREKYALNELEGQQFDLDQDKAHLPALNANAVTSSNLGIESQQIGNRMARLNADIHSKYGMAMADLSYQQQQEVLADMRKSPEELASDARIMNEALNPDAYATGEELGTKMKEYMDAAYPGTSALARMGVSPAAQVEQSRSRTAGMMQLQEMRLKKMQIDAQKYVADKSANATVTAAAINAGAGAGSYVRGSRTSGLSVGQLASASSYGSDVAERAAGGKEMLGAAEQLFKYKDLAARVGMNIRDNKTRSMGDTLSYIANVRGQDANERNNLRTNISNIKSTKLRGIFDRILQRDSHDFLRDKIASETKLNRAKASESPARIAQMFANAEADMTRVALFAGQLEIAQADSLGYQLERVRRGELDYDAFQRWIQEQSFMKSFLGKEASAVLGALRQLVTMMGFDVGAPSSTNEPDRHPLR